jgi:hypothetical protein
MRLLALTSILIVAVPVALGGCGKRDPTQTPVAAPSKKEYVRKVNRVCTRLTRHFKKYPKAKTSGAALRLFDSVQEETERAIGRLRSFQRPAGKPGRTAEKWIRAVEREYVKQQLPLILEMQEAFKARDRAAVRAAARKFDALDAKPQASDRLAKRLGARKCATES